MSNSLQADFSFIRYANCWEDADVLLQGLSIRPGEKVLSVASAGDNSFSLLTCDPEIVTAADVSAVQLFLTRLKQEAIRQLAYEDLLAFLGIHDSANRRQVFDLLKKELDSSTRSYFEKHIDLVEEGIIHQGKFERYFRTFRKKILPLVHSRRCVKQLFTERDASGQRGFYDKSWNTWRWRLLFRLFFNRKVMGKYGRDPEFFRQVGTPVAEEIFNRAERHLSSQHVSTNYFLHMIMLGSFGDKLPHYLRPENMSRVKENINRLETRQAYIQELMGKGVSYSAFNFSNIFEYMKTDDFQSFARLLADNTSPGDRFAYWNLLVPRRFHQVMPGYFVHREISSEADKGFFYDQFITDSRI